MIFSRQCRDIFKRLDDIFVNNELLITLTN